MNKKKILVGSALCLLVSACGVARDTLNHARSVNLPEFGTKLYDPDFYRAATPGEVRELVAGRSLAEESTTVTKKQFVEDDGEHGGHYRLFVQNDWYPFFSSSGVATTTWVLRPVDLARGYSPNREVVRIVEQASSIDGLAYSLVYRQYFLQPSGVSSSEKTGNHEAAYFQSVSVADLLEEYQSAPFSCSAVFLLAGHGHLAELDAYLARHPGADLNCAPQPVTSAPWRRLVTTKTETRTGNAPEVFRPTRRWPQP